MTVPSTQYSDVLQCTLNRDSDLPGVLLLYDSACHHTAATQCPLFKHGMRKFLSTQLGPQFAAMI